MLSFTGWNLWGGCAYIAFTQGINILLNIFLEHQLMQQEVLLYKFKTQYYNFPQTFKQQLIHK